MKEHKHHKGCMLIALGVIILVNRLYLNWDWWLLFGGLFILKGLKVMFLMKECKCECKSHEKKSK